MESRSFQPKSVRVLDVELAARILRTGSVHDPALPDVAAAFGYFEELGVIKTSVSEYVKCAESKDKDYRFAHDRSCRGRIRLEKGFDVARGDYECPECSRPIYPSGKIRHKEVRVELLRDNIAAHLEKLLDGTGFTWKKLAPWVWRVDTPEEAKLAVIDYCDQQYHSREWAAHNSACYIAVDGAGCDVRFLSEKWLGRTRLADIICAKVDLKKLLQAAAKTKVPDVATASIPVYHPTIRPIVAASEKKIDAVTPGAKLAPLSNGFIREGQFWKITYSGVTKPLKDIKGIDYIVYLIRNQGKDVQGVLMFAELAGDEKLKSTGSAGEILDKTAIDKYKERLADLTEQIDRAKKNNDFGPQESLEKEFAMVHSQLASAIGLRGRKKNASDDAERIRKSVSNAISRSLDQIKNDHPALWQHLDKSLNFGQYFSYSPEKFTPWNT
jgi:hypothetical protein